ncbi:Na(+)/citrate cotransporter-like [Styela clava]
MRIKEFFKILWNFRSTLLLILLPIVMLPIPIVLDSTEAACGYCIIIMAAYWISEVLPLAVTSFLPLIMFPLMGIMPASAVSVVYLKDTNWLFVGGLMIAVAVEHTCLHKRIALRVLLAVGSKPESLMIGFMLPTYFLSMWISNTATTAMMIPIVNAVLGELVRGPSEYQNDQELEDGPEQPDLEKTTGFTTTNIDVKSQNTESNTDGVKSYQNSTFKSDESDIDSVNDATKAEETETASKENDVAVVQPEPKHESGKLEKGLTLCVPYAASIGGITTLTGTGPNLVLAGQYPILFPDAEPPITFSNWMAYHLPLSLSLLLLSYIWLMWLFLDLSIKSIRTWCGRGNKTERDRRVNELLVREYAKLGDIRWAEVTVLIVFTTTALLWFFRDPGFIPGWSVLFKDGYVSDGTVAMTMACLLFFLPSKRPTFLGKRPEKINDIKPVPPVLDWPTVHRMFPWNVVFLLGGGFALAEGATVSGFSDWLGEQLLFLNGLPNWVICLIVTVITCLFTECTSNVATASLFVPIIAELAQGAQIHPLYLLLPTVVSTSLAFMLPVATPPNAIAFSYGHLKVVDLVKAGWMLNLLGILILMVFVNTYGIAFYGLDEFPYWASENYTGPTDPPTTMMPLI